MTGHKVNQMEAVPKVWCPAHNGGHRNDKEGSERTRFHDPRTETLERALNSKSMTSQTSNQIIFMIWKLSVLRVFSLPSQQHFQYYKLCECQRFKATLKPLHLPKLKSSIIKFTSWLHFAIRNEKISTNHNFF